MSVMRTIGLPRTARPGATAHRILLAALLPVLIPACTDAPQLQIVPAEDVGMSSQVLDQIGPAVEEFVNEGGTGGVLTLVSRRGELVHFEAHGVQTEGDPLQVDDIFRIYSMTKPITSVAAMMLVEEGLLSLDDPVASYIPAFADVQVWDDGELREPARPMTVQHLLTHTSGLTYGIFGDTPVDQMYVRELDGVSMRSGRTLAETAEVIASLPLLDDPGDQWIYSVSTDVLGRVVEVASGMSLDQFFQTRIFAPLGMTETGFSVPEGDRHRLVDMYGPGASGPTSALTASDGSPPDWFSGGGGLYSTAADYLRFATMLLNGGELDGVRLLTAETVDDMRRNHLPESMLPIGGAWPDAGFGLGFAVSMGENPGNYFWLGAADTYFWIDPDDEMIVFAWTQHMPTFGAPVDQIVAPIVYEAILPGL